MKQLLAATLILATAAPATAAETWGTIGSWTISRTETACVALQGVNGGAFAIVNRIAGPTLIEYTSPGTGRSFTGEIVLRQGGQEVGRFPLAVDPIDEELAATFVADQSGAIYGADRFAIVGARRKTIEQGALPGFAQMMSRVSRCRREAANVDKGTGQPADKPPVTLSAGVTADDYPSIALRQEMQGRTIAVVTVSAKGRVSNCQIQTSSGFPVLDDATCDIVSRRGRFRPARDASGGYTEGTTTVPINWQIPQ